MDDLVESIMNTGWFTVRCVFEVDPQRWDGSEPRTYEERITLWQAAGMDAAIVLAEVEANEYATTVDARYLGVTQCCKADVPEQGAEIYSLMRDSELDPSAYIDRFFDTGTERQQRV